MAEPAVLADPSFVPGFADPPQTSTVEYNRVFHSGLYRSGGGPHRAGRRPSPVLARSAVLALPAAALALGWAAIARVPSLAAGVPPPAPAEALRLSTLVLGLVGCAGVTAILAGTRGRAAARAGLVATVLGSVGVGGRGGVLPFILLLAGWCLVGAAVLCSRVLNRGDGALLILGAGALAVGAATGQVAVDLVAALLLLAAGLGLAAGRPPD
jgi:hypothetical protein